jgi:hypothetical protein
MAEDKNIDPQQEEKDKASDNEVLKDQNKDHQEAATSDEKAEQHEPESSASEESDASNKTNKDKSVPSEEKEPAEEDSTNSKDTNDDQANKENTRDDEDSVDNIKAQDDQERKDESQQDTEVDVEKSDTNEINEVKSKDHQGDNDHEAKPLHKDSIPKKNYASMSPDELVIELTNLVKNEKVQHIREHVNDIKAIFDKKFDEIIQEKKKDFIDQGGNIIDFQYTSPIKKRFNAVYFDYREKRDKYYTQLKKNLQQNLKTRLSIIEELKNMIGSGESMSENYRKFKELQEKWKNAGDVPKAEKNRLWNDYHHHVERFYDFLHLDREFRELNYKHNLDQKLKLISRAEELAEEDDVNRAFRELQLLHKIWKEELGPVDKAYSDEIWEKFSAATKKVHERRREHLAKLDEQHEKNLEIKEDVIEQMKKISEEEIKSHRDAQEKIKMVEKLRDIFKKAGKVPLRDKDRVWDELKEHNRNFNRKKNQFYKDLKKQQFENLEKKKELIRIAEENKDSEDFETTTPLMKKIQYDWKKIGHVPRKESDKIWKQFKAACNHYFDRFHDTQEKVHDEAFENFLSKKDLVSKLKSLEISGKKDDDLPKINEIIDEWSELGSVPQNKRYVEGKFHKTLDQLFKKIEDIDYIDAELIKYEPRMRDFENADDQRSIKKEIGFLQNKIEETEDKINKFENNKSFLNPSESANEMIKDIDEKIEQFQKELAMWKTKLSQVRGLLN